MIRLSKWLDNYWYHYKWITIITAFFIIFFAVAISQIATREKVDINVLYTGSHVYSPTEIHSIQYAFEQTMALDYNGDGKKCVALKDISLMSRDQILEAREKDPDLVVNAQAMLETEKNFNLEIFAGESIICLLDPYWYNSVHESSGLRPLKEILDVVPEYAIDDCGVYLKDTDFGQYFTVFDALPDDTVLCIRRMSTTSMFKGKSSEEKRYSYHVQMLKDILSFKFPDGYTKPS